MAEIAPNTSYVAVLGWSLRAIEAIDRFNRKYIVVAPSWAEEYAKDNAIPYIPWEFERLNDRSVELYERLAEEGVEVAVPLYEETVEWAGAINARLQNKPRLFPQSLLFRDKSLMKRRAQLAGIRVGVFEEAHDRDDVRRFLLRVNKALLKLDGDPNDPIHMKPFDKAGTYGHRVIKTNEDIDAISDDEFPCLLESHLDGKEFACEVFIHDGKIRFLNISEYVHLGYSVFIPASPGLEEWRPQIRKAVEHLIQAFEIEHGLIHPEFFITHDGNLHFGEVAYRVPGGNAFELIERAYGFNAYQAHVLVSDPKATEQEIQNFFPREVVDAKGFAGCFLVYPKQRVISDIDMPEAVENDPYYEKHDLFMPANPKVAERVAFGNHYGTVYFFGDDPDRMRELLLKQEEYDFYR
ncbi:MAG: ATP-grasp domain-containing protein [Nitrococcus mobilis]|nr:ATP-grasp domain-containing protein [Nitrococcus mobilis]